MVKFTPKSWIRRAELKYKLPLFAGNNRNLSSQCWRAALGAHTLILTLGKLKQEDRCEFHTFLQNKLGPCRANLGYITKRKQFSVTGNFTGVS